MGCHFLLHRIFLTWELNLPLFTSSALAGGFFTTSTTWEVLGDSVHKLPRGHTCWNDGPGVRPVCSDGDLLGPKRPGQEGGGERWGQWDRTEADLLPREPGSCGAPGVADWAGSTVGVREAGQWNRVWSVIPRSSPPRKSPAGTVEAGAGLLYPPPRIWLCEEQLRARLRAARAALKPGGTGARAPWKRCGDLGHHCSLV